MQNTHRNMVEFKSSAFNTTETLPHFINPCCFGEDVALWLQPQFSAVGYEVDAPGQEDWGWYLNCRQNGLTHTLNIGYVFDDEESVWRIYLERRRPVMVRLFGRNRENEPDLARALHSILTAASEVTEIGWYVSDNKGQETGPYPQP